MKMQNLQLRIVQFFTSVTGGVTLLAMAILLGGCDSPNPPMVLNTDSTFETSVPKPDDGPPEVGNLGGDWYIDFDSGQAVSVNDVDEEVVHPEVAKKDFILDTSDVNELHVSGNITDPPAKIELKSDAWGIDGGYVLSGMPPKGGPYTYVAKRKSKKTTGGRKSTKKIALKVKVATKKKGHFTAKITQPPGGTRRHTLDIQAYDDDEGGWEDDFFCMHCDDDDGTPFAYVKRPLISVYGILGGGSSETTSDGLGGGGVHFIDSGIDNPNGPGDILIPVKSGGPTLMEQKHGLGSGFIGGGGIGADWFWGKHMGAGIGVEGLAGPNDAAAVLKATLDIAIPLANHNRLQFGIGPGVVLGSHFADPVAVLDAKFIHPITPKVAGFVGVEGLFGGDTSIGEVQLGCELKF